MKLGQIENFKITGCYYAGTRVPKEYKLNGSGNCAFGWDDVYDVPVDVEISFGEEWFVGAIDLNLCGGVKKLEVYNKGEKVAVHSGESGKTVGGYMVIPVSVYASALTIRFYPHFWRWISIHFAFCELRRTQSLQYGLLSAV